ncbi:unnamed protein product, partial [marine sediment metagenome]
STSIEGNRLTLEEVKALSEHKEVVATDKDKQEVANYLEALDAIPGFAAKKEITTVQLLSIHNTITKKTLENAEHCGTFRKQRVFVGKRIFDGTQLKTVVEYEPPKVREVPGLVDEFLKWLNSDRAKNVIPVILAGVAHYEIARIHPFIDGNGRTARLLASLILYKSGFDHRRFFALDDYYNEDRPSYYTALKTVDKQKGDLTKWLEYFTNGVLYSVSKVKETIEKLNLLPSVERVEQIELTPRQIEILEKIKRKGKITNKELRIAFKVSRQAVIKEVSKLIGAKLIELVGKGRGAYYKISE